MYQQKEVQIKRNNQIIPHGDLSNTDCLRDSKRPVMYKEELTSDPIPILLVEDNPADARLTEELINETQCPVSISVVRDGDEAIRVIDKLCNDGSMPRLILLDLKLPKRGGLEVLKHIRGLNSCRNVKVAILTGSLLPEDRMGASELNADAYLIKPMTLQEFGEIADALKSLISECSFSE